jgi:3-oxoacyl-[acyl-carrier protein] reductase
MNPRNRNAIVTGASTGIGQAIALALARRGAHVAVLGRRRADLEGTASEARTHGVQAIAILCDVGNREEVRAAVARVEEELGPVDLLVNCAGYHVWRPFADTSEHDHQQMMNVNYWGAFHTIRAVLPGMRQRQRGAIVNIAAGSAKLVLPITSGFSASKAALAALSESLRRELRGSGVAVSCLFPASVRTGFWDRDRVDTARLPPVVRWAPKLSAASVARQVCWTVRCGFAQRTLPFFLAFSVRLDALWPRFGDVILARWGLAAVVGAWLFYRAVAV